MGGWVDGWMDGWESFAFDSVTLYSNWAQRGVKEIFIWEYPVTSLYLSDVWTLPLSVCCSTHQLASLDLTFVNWAKLSDYWTTGSRKPHSAYSPVPYTCINIQKLQKKKKRLHVVQLKHICLDSEAVWLLLKKCYVLFLFHTARIMLWIMFVFWPFQICCLII
jgi:hypothetical protein